LSKKYNIVVDENMLGIEKLFSEIADITYVSGRLISAKMLENSDALLCRSITQVNESLLDNSQVKFVGTATIGIDHLDIEWLNKKGIDWSNAAGCNAPAVGQYILSAIAYWCIQKNRSIKDLTVGIIGAGNVGSMLTKYLTHFGINYKLCDPPLKELGDEREFTDLESILKCDVISIHVPITSAGEHPTHYLFSEHNLTRLNKNQLLINASRGAVIDNLALSDYLKSANSADCILDVFENEPNINPLLVNQCILATPHIAGHTLEGKLRGSWMIYAAFCKRFALPLNRLETELYPSNNLINLSGSSLEEDILSIYDICLDAMLIDSKLIGSRLIASKSLKAIPNNEIKNQFDHLRKDATKLSNGYIRRDYTGWTVNNKNSILTIPTD
jgi:erythronate-4-phosphate dehydrogenase